MCLVVFQKIFRKIFSGVWKMLQGKRQNQKNKHNTQIDAYDRRRSTTRCFANSNPTTSRSSEAPRRFARSRSTARSRTVSIAIDGAISHCVDRNRHKGEIAIDGAILRSVDRDLREGKIAINGAILRSVDRDLAKHCADRDRRKGEFAISDRD